ncbi:MAG: hypothetical protein ACPG31_09090 [Planctomycetota bacterium]
MAKELNKIQAKAQKKKITILAVMVLFTAMTWSKTLLGKDDKPTPAASPAPVAGASTASKSSATPAKTVVARTAITSYQQAVARMELWPVALKRQVHTGAIEELTPINDLLATDQPPLEEDLPPLEQLLPVPPPIEDLPPEEPEVLFEELRLKLTTTADFGKDRIYAIINGEQVSMGQAVEVQVDGQTVRYEVRAIGTRMVELAYEGQTHVLRIGLPELEARDQDGA